jgi:hypothetical protein
MGMAMMPWLLMYAISSYVFAHPQGFQQRFEARGVPQWKKRFERSYDVPVPEGDELRELGARIMRDTGLTGSFGAYRQGPNQVNVYRHTFWESTQVKYFIKEKKLVGEDRTFRWEHFLTGMHARGGFHEDDFLTDLWGVVVDIVSVGFLLWIASGLYMWWTLAGVRAWGWLALLGGVLSFSLFLWGL